MVKHIVCFKLAEPTEKLVGETLSVLRSMVGKVPSAVDIQAHADELHSSRSYDIILEVVVDSWDALDVYQNDPYHCNIVKKHMHAVASSSIALDFAI
ncbi:MAG: Dabb family protein [Candidatus Aphodosoma sp.]